MPATRWPRDLVAKWVALIESGEIDRAGIVLRYRISDKMLTKKLMEHRKLSKCPNTNQKTQTVQHVVR